MPKQITDGVTTGWYVEGWGYDKFDEGCVMQLSRIFQSLKTATEWADEARKVSEKPETVQVRTKFYNGRKHRDSIFV